MKDSSSGPSQIRGLMIVGSSLLWLFFVYTIYYVVHKPVTDIGLAQLKEGWTILWEPSSVAAMLDSMGDLLAALWILILAAGLGTRVWTLMVRDQGSVAGKAEIKETSENRDSRSGATDSLRLETLVLGTGLGLGIVSTVTFLLGLMGLWRRDLFYGLSLAGIALLIPQLWTLARVAGRTWWGRNATLGLTASALGTKKDPLRTVLPATVGKRDRTEQALAIYCLMVLGLGLVTALAPPTGWDGLAYHLAAPKIYIENGRIISGIDVPHFYFPALVDTLFAYAMLLRGDVSAQLLHYAYLVLSAGAVFGFACQFLGRKTAYYAVAIFLSVPTLIIHGTIAYVDLALVFYITTSFWAVMNWLAARRLSWLMMAAVMAGFAMGVKYTSAPFVVGLFLVIGIGEILRLRAQNDTNKAPQNDINKAQDDRTGGQIGRTLGEHDRLLGEHDRLWGEHDRPGSGGVILRNEESRGGVQPREGDLDSREGEFPNEPGAGGSSLIAPLLVFTIISLLIASPWFFKNFAFTGNPFYPFAFGGWSWDSWRSDWYGRPGTGLFHDPLRLLIAPLEATLLGIEGGIGYQATIGPLLLVLLPLIFLIARNRIINLCLAFSAFGYLSWLAGAAFSDSLQQTRLLLPIFGVLSVLTAFALKGMAVFDRPVFRLSRFFGAAFSLVLVITLFMQAVSFIGEMPLGPVLGKESRGDFLTRRLGDHYRATRFVNSNLPQDAYVYFLYEPRTYFSERRSQPDTLLDNWARPLFQYGSVDGILSQLKERGVTYLLVYQGGLDYLLRNQRSEANTSHVELLMDFEKRYLTRVYGEPLRLSSEKGKTALAISGPMYSVYEIRYP